MGYRAVLITGAAHRIGRGLALDLAAAGWAVAVHYNQSARAAQDLVAEITAQNGQAVAVGADLADASAVAGLIPDAVQKLGQPLHALINNASLFIYDDWTDWTVDQWDHHMAVNLRAPAQLMQAFVAQAPQDVPSHQRPSVVNIIDQRVWSPTPHFASYTTSKSALWAATQTAAQGYAPHVRVNAIGPGPVLQSVHQTETEFAHQWASTPLERGTTVEEIAQAVRFLLDAPAVTGQMISCDGGEHLDWRLGHVLNPKG